MTPKRTHRRYTADFKAEVALAALTERQPLAELAAHYHLAKAQIPRWKQQLREPAAQVFTDAPAPSAPGPDVEPLYAAIGRLQLENALLKKRGPNEHRPATRPRPRPRPSWRVRGRPLPGPGPGAQQLLLPALRGKCLYSRPHAPA